MESLSLFALVLLTISSVYGQSGSNTYDPKAGSMGSSPDSGCTPNQVMIGQRLVKKYCEGLGQYKQGSQNQENYDTCIAKAVRDYAGDCLRSSEEADDLATILCNNDGTTKQHSAEVNKRLCCVGIKVENDKEKYEKAKTIISNCRGKYPERLF